MKSSVAFGWSKKPARVSGANALESAPVPTDGTAMPDGAVADAAAPAAAAPPTTRREKRKKWGDAPPSAEAEPGETPRRRGVWGFAADVDLPAPPARPSLPIAPSPFLPPQPLPPARALAAGILPGVAPAHAAMPPPQSVAGALPACTLAAPQALAGVQSAPPPSIISLTAPAAVSAPAVPPAPAVPAATAGPAAPAAPAVPPKPAPVKMDLAVAANTALQQIIAMTAAMAKVPPNAAIAAVGAALQSNGAFQRSLPGAAMQKAADSAFTDSTGGAKSAAPAGGGGSADGNEDENGAARTRRKRGRGASPTARTGGVADAADALGDVDAADGALAAQQAPALGLVPLALRYLSQLTAEQLIGLPASELSRLHSEHLLALRVFGECEQRRLLGV
ncbi:hypothetical protein KFE25_013438 [Diacronema lutheri]|uniref:Uncharacterized protein n=1 Tax=Diacronema lutheri TaxID=2081491 RepID=A0A8J5XZF3_DIALT|nr:hypothetical protein KFE25_013438 [Diacronema lutheri]